MTRRLAVSIGTIAFVGASALTPAAFAGGANESCVLGGEVLSCYDDPTNQGFPSENGNGKGNAYGKPAAGTVGNADTKNPPGQVKKYADALETAGPLDDNGYECDGNSGVAKGNPAHSGCQEAED